MSRVDKQNVTLASGAAVTVDHRELKENGQQKDYVVLSADERAKGFVRPVRQSYVHAGLNPEMNGGVLIKPGAPGCGTLTKMSLPIAETYAREPGFYNATFCVSCREHRPLAEFIWCGSADVVGS